MDFAYKKEKCECECETKNKSNHEDNNDKTLIELFQNLTVELSKVNEKLDKIEERTKKINKKLKSESQEFNLKDFESQIYEIAKTVSMKVFKARCREEQEKNMNGRGMFDNPDFNGIPKTLR